MEETEQTKTTPQGNSAPRNRNMIANMSCPTVEELTAYADLTLIGAPRRALRQHLRHCTECSRAVLAMQRALSPIRDRHQGVGGWKGPLESATGTLPDNIAPAWQEHLKHCQRCSERTALLQLRRPMLAISGASLAFGVVACALVFTSLSPPQPATSELVNKSVQTNLPEGVPGLLESYLNPPDSQLTQMIGFWEEVRKSRSESLAVYAALVPLYERALAKETQPERRAELERYIGSLKARCKELVS